MSVTVLSEPDRWIRKNLTGQASLYSKIIAVQAHDFSEVVEWARVYAQQDHMKSKGEDVTRFNIQKVGAAFGVHFYWEVEN